MGVSEMGRPFYIQTKETEDQTMATKKTAVIPEEEILAAATDENINEHSLHQTETEPEPIECSALKGHPETLISSTFARLIPNLRIPKGCRSKTPRATPRKHRYPRPIPTRRKKNLKRARRPAEPENQEPRKVSLTQQRQNRPGMHPTASQLRRRSLAGAPLPDRRRRWYPSTSAPVWKRKRTRPATICWTW